MSPFQLILRVPITAVLLLAGSFGIAWHAQIAVRDTEFFISMPGMTKHLLGTGFAIALALLVLWRFRDYVLIALAVLFLPMFGLVWYALSSGALSNPLILMKEVGPATSQLRTEIEKAHTNGAQPASVEDLRKMGVFDEEDFLDGEYYGPEAYSWESRFSESGRLIGEIHVAGDPTRNAPDWISVFGPSKVSALHAGEFREGLPILSRDRPRNSDRGKRINPDR